MEQQTIRVLLIDDDQDYYVLTRDLLSDVETGRYALEWIQAYAAGLAALTAQPYEVCLLDYDLGEQTGIELLQAAKRAGSQVPVIMLTGHGGYQVDLAAMRGGAVDYVSKAAITAIGLERAIRYAIDRAQTLQAIGERERRIAELYEREQLRSQELERVYAGLRQAEASRDEFIHMLVHDLRGPLTAILANVDLMGRVPSVPAPDSLSRLVVRIQANVRRILDMIDDLLKVSRLEGGVLLPNLSAFCITTWLTERAADYRLQAERDNKAVSVSLAPELPTIQVDADLIGRVIDNLVANALKFTSSGAHISISADCRERSLVVSVMDDGPGISAEDQAHIFDKYYQISQDDHSSTHSGIGIGLTFCRLAVEAHGGSIWVESTPNHGSVFSFSLPIVNAP